MAEVTKPAEGSWTGHYPELGTGLVSYADSISPELYELEGEAIFKRAWLNVGRVDQLPRKGSFFTKNIAAARSSVVILRDLDGEVRGFHNVCRHRGNKLLWDHSPNSTAQGVCRQFTCKYHGWRYGLDGTLCFALQEEEFFDFDKNDFGLVPVHCDVWEGFIFVNLDREPRQSLREFLGPMVTGMEGYPFGLMTERYAYEASVNANWKRSSSTRSRSTTTRRSSTRSSRCRSCATSTPPSRCPTSSSTDRTGSSAPAGGRAHLGT